ncbi:sugar transporter ERD6-like 7 isoform X2 [Cryptotermes secundus]|uniref:sugar transporter ERD6-like 7 isoform X2 n=1 Tax=Cryptotermes secundus TaxID=105785 RepID=UPI000CD7B12A|nr:sugar transporter ERD6-like 7 isoform X2 [Cryptotermes secundus]XP_023707926.1 sugar transporter ERD6-like 7 isoform X2 [Cryptotermes secundus]XP_023707936.1 sugar transporter ERD6-like 7 isoform X2 [Cryptotermes secundus]
MSCCHAGRRGDSGWQHVLCEVLASCVAHSIVVQAGVSMAYSAVLLPQLADPDSIPTATKDQSSWIGLSTVALVYVSEVSNPKIRPMLLCLNSVFVSFGILLTCVLAQWFFWRGMAIWFGVLAAMSFLALWFLPESPHWLATYREEEGGSIEAAVRWLNRHPQVSSKCYDF